MADVYDDEKGGLPDLTKKILTLGLGAYFLTEDTVRRYVKDAKLPRDVAKSITQNAAKGKDELYGFVARELGSFLEKMDVQAELHRFVQNHKIKVSAEIEFVNKKPAAEADAGAESDSGEVDTGDLEWNVSFKTGSEESDVDKTTEPN